MVNPYGEIMILESGEVLELVSDYQKCLERKDPESAKEVLDTLIEAHVGLIIKRISYFVKKVFKARQSSETMQLLFQEGVVGVIQAAQKFDSGYNTVFSTYVTYYIDRAIRIALKNDVETVHFPLWVYDWANRERLHNYSDATKLAIEFQRNMPTAQRYLYIENDGYEKEGQGVSSVILESEMDYHDYGSEQEFYHDANVFKRMVEESCNKRELHIIYKHLVDNDSLKDIGEHFGMSGEGVNKIRNSTIDKIMAAHSMTLSEIVMGLSFVKL